MRGKLRPVRTAREQTLHPGPALESLRGFRCVSADLEERWHWQNYDLASLVENHFCVQLDPARITDEERQHWGPRVIGQRSVAPSFDTAYWLMDGNRRVGTIGVGSSDDSRAIAVSSLYVVPAERGKGHGTGALRAVRAQATRAGFLGVQLETEWSWQRAVRYYLKLGFWVKGWTLRLAFVSREDLPSWKLEFEPTRAKITLNVPEGPSPWIEAHAQGEALDWTEHWEPTTPKPRALHGLISRTFALALATQGFPLLTRKDVAFRRENPRLERVGPSALASKIRQFEARDRALGYGVNTPRIPGLGSADLQPNSSSDTRSRASKRTPSDSRRALCTARALGS